MPHFDCNFVDTVSILNYFSGMVIEKIKSEFEARSKKNPAYSLRAFAQSLDIDSSTLSSLLSGKRTLTQKTALKILNKFDISNIERKELLFASLKNKSKTENLRFIEDAELEMISNWEHFAILALVETAHFQSNIKYISTQLNIPSATVILALDRLMSLGLIKKIKNKIVVCHNSIETTQDIPSAALRKAHKQYIEKAIYSLENHATLDRDITGTTIAIKKSNLPEAKKLIREFRKSLTELLESGKKDDVYRLNIQLFPLRK